MMTSAQKTKIIVINKEPTRHKMEIVSVSIEQILETKYLMITRSNYEEVEKKVGDQVQKVHRLAGCLNNTICRNVIIVSIIDLF